MSTTYTTRTIPTTSYTTRTRISSNLFLKIDSSHFLKIDSSNKLVIDILYWTPYTVRTPI